MPYLVLRTQPRKTHTAHVRGEHALSPRWNLAGDIIQVLPDEHVFSEAERRKFAILRIPNLPGRVAEVLVEPDHETFRPRRYRIKPMHLLVRFGRAVERAIDPKSPVAQAEIPTVSWSMLRGIVWNRVRDRLEDVTHRQPTPPPPGALEGS